SSTSRWSSTISFSTTRCFTTSESEGTGGEHSQLDPLTTQHSTGIVAAVSCAVRPTLAALLFAGALYYAVRMQARSPRPPDEHAHGRPKGVRRLRGPHGRDQTHSWGREWSMMPVGGGGCAMSEVASSLLQSFVLTQPERRPLRQRTIASARGPNS